MSGSSAAVSCRRSLARLGNRKGALIVSEAARVQLAAIRDEFVAPLVDRIQAQADEIGALKAERDALWSRLEQLEAGQDATVAANQGSGATKTVDVGEERPRRNRRRSGAASGAR